MEGAYQYLESSRIGTPVFNPNAVPPVSSPLDPSTVASAVSANQYTIKSLISYENIE